MMSQPNQKALTKGSAKEIIGTFFIALASFGLADGGFQQALVVGGVYALFTWHSSDGAFNPAWTAARLTKDNAVGGVIQILAQVVGAALAAVCAPYVGGTTLSVSGGGDLSTGLTDAFLTLFVLFTYSKSKSPDGLNLGLAYFAALSALPSQFGANASVLLGVVLGNAALGNGLDLGAGTIWGFLVPVLVGVVFQFVVPYLEKIPRNTELFGTFVFALVALSIGEGEAGSLLATGAALHTAHTNFNGALNPAVTLGKVVAAGSYSTWGDPLFDIIAQLVGATLAAVALSFAGDGASVAAGSSIDASATIEVLFAFALMAAYLSNKSGDTLALGLSYFAVASLCASSFNASLNLGAYFAGLAGFGSGDVGLNLLFPIVGACLAASKLLDKAKIPGDVTNAALLFIGAGASGTDNLLVFGAFVVALDMTGAGAPNPALTLSKGTGRSNLEAIGFQLLGGVVGAVVVGLVGGDSASVSDGNGLGQSVVAELLIVTLYLRLLGSGYTGLSYYAALAVFGGAAGSIANPITAVGSYVGGGLVGFLDGSGGGFDTSNAALTSLASHTLAPLLGGLAAFHGYDLLWPKDRLAKVDLKGFSSDELFGSLLFVLASFAVSGLDYALVLFALFSGAGLFNRNSVDLLPALSLAKANLAKANDLVAFAYKLVAQVLGAVLAALLGGWLLGDTTAAGETSGDLGSLLVCGAVLGLLLRWAFVSASKGFELAVAFNAVTAIFSGVAYNGAATLGVALLAGDFGFASDSAWWAAFLAPLIGAVLGNYIASSLA